jgi:outer membrane receptor protein involved in Fe transport
MKNPDSPKAALLHPVWGLIAVVAAGSPARGQAASPASAATRPNAVGETVTLSPFEVVADATDTYDATNTNSVTGTSTPLNRTPLDARIFNRTIMDELGVVDVARMLGDLAGLGLPLLSAGTEDQRGMQEGDGVDYKSMTSRGLTISNPRRDGFLRSETSLMDSFDVESAEALQGSNSLLFGSGDAGGVININSKRARLRQRSLAFSAKFDSEGSDRFTADLNAGTEKFGLRLNAVKGRERYYRPILGFKQDGIQLAATLRPFKWLGVFGDYRHYERDHIRANTSSVTTPASMTLPNGELLNGMSARRLVGLGGSAIFNNFITLTNNDSMSGAFTRHHHINESKTVTVELTPSRDLAFQFRYGHDSRVNKGLNPSNTAMFHPDAPGNLMTDASGALARQWAFNTTMTATPLWTGAHGYKATGVYHLDLGKWGDHRLNVFHSMQESWQIQVPKNFYELDASGNPVLNPANITNTSSGRNLMPAVWMPAFTERLIGGIAWPSDYLVHPVNGRSYRFLPQVHAGAVAPTARNPLGLSGPINAATGQSTITGNFWEDTSERSTGFSTFSSFWKGRIDTMAGFRFERADSFRVDTGIARGPIDYNSSTLGAVVDTPLPGVRIYGNYATNAKISFGTDTDINNQQLPIGKGVSREAGLKFSLWNHRISGNIAYYVTEAKNFAGTLGGTRDDVDPAGINGRNGGQGYTYSKKSDGISASLSAQPLPWWQVTLSFAQANGSERSTIALPVFYNDEFNTTTVNGQPVVAVKTASTGALAPLLVRSVPGNAASAQVPLSIAMMKDPTSPYFATLDPQSGQILNAQTLGLLTTGVGTARTGLPISNHQLGFAPPTPTILVRAAGENTTGYAENALSLINRFQVREGRFRGLVLGLATIAQTGIRGYMYTDAATANRRRIFFYPDRFEQNAFLVYSFRPLKSVRASVQLNISNLFDRQEVVALPRSTNGVVRYFAYQYSPRKIALTTNLSF